MVQICEKYLKVEEEFLIKNKDNFNFKNQKGKVKIFDLDNNLEREFLEEDVFKIEKKTKIKIGGFGKLNILILNNCDLYFEFFDDSFVEINFQIKKNLKVNLFEIVNNKNFAKKNNFKLEKNSILNHRVFNLNCFYLNNIVNLYKNSNYFFDSLNFNLDNNFFNIFENVFLKKSLAKVNLNIKNILDNCSKITSFSKICVLENSFDCTCFESQKNYILSKNSNIISMPILEIKNNQIKCSHSSFVSNIELDNLFYLNSRGINYKNYINLILKGAFLKFLENILDKDFKEQFLKNINSNLTIFK